MKHFLQNVFGVLAIIYLLGAWVVIFWTLFTYRRPASSWQVFLLRLLLLMRGWIWPYDFWQAIQRCVTRWLNRQIYPLRLRHEMIETSDLPEAIELRRQR